MNKQFDKPQFDVPETRPTPLRKRVNQFVGVVLVALIGSCVAIYPIEIYRIQRFCDSVTPGASVKDATETAERMWGVDLWQISTSNTVVVKSSFAFKTLCIIETENGAVVSADFSGD